VRSRSRQSWSASGLRAEMGNSGSTAGSLVGPWATCGAFHSASHLPFDALSINRGYLALTAFANKIRGPAPARHRDVVSSSGLWSVRYIRLCRSLRASGVASAGASVLLRLGCPSSCVHSSFRILFACTAKPALNRDSRGSSSRAVAVRPGAYPDVLKT
jgi:hypothetical protein